MKHLYFIRHGMSEFNKAYVWAGSSDTPLTPEGHEQAKEAGRKAREQGLVFDVVISSPLSRAHETAKHVAKALDYPHKNIVIHNGIVERNFGKLEGRKDLLASTKYVLDESAIDTYDGVESMEQLQKRADDFLAHLRTLPHDSILVVGHGAFARALRRSVNKEPLSSRGRRLHNAEIVRLI